MPRYHDVGGAQDDVTAQLGARRCPIDTRSYTIPKISWDYWLNKNVYAFLLEAVILYISEIKHDICQGRKNNQQQVADARA